MTLLAAFLPPDFQWSPVDTWTVVVAAIASMACALLGCYLVLRRMSLMGDALSHAVLPGLAGAFLLSGSRDSLVMLAGAGVIGLLTAAFTEWIHRGGKVDEGASMGVVFTVLFAVGLILIRVAADHTDLDPDCVLYGSLETAPLDTVPFLGANARAPALLGGAMLLVNLVFVVALYKELKISAFDPGLATVLGFAARGLHYALMALVAATTVAAFQSVGSILVIAMLIVPAATAHLLTDRLSRMLMISVALAAGAAGAGHFLAIVARGWIGYEGVSTSTSGMMAVVLGVCFLLTMLLAPRYGLIRRWNFTRASLHA